MSSNETNVNRILLIGGTGFIGSAIGEKFAELGWEVHVLTRKIRPNQTSFPCTQHTWDGKAIPDSAIMGMEAVINLAGQGIADQAWSKEYRKKILESRVSATRALAKAVLNLKDKPKVIVQASAVGFFGMQDRQDACNETSTPGQDFLSDVCQAWEAEAIPIQSVTRLCIARIGLVLGWGGGALAELWDIYTSGVGSVLGKGKQWMNWIHIEDIVNFFVSAVLKEKYSGLYNLVAPDNVINKSFHEALAERSSSLKKLQAPGVCLRVVLGSRADLVLKGPQVTSTRLSESSFKFRFPKLSGALSHLFTERTHPKAHYLKVKQWVPADINAVWAFMSSTQNLEKLTPQWLHFNITKQSTPVLEQGSKIDYSLKLHGIPLNWQSHITSWTPKAEFIDEQDKGPYKLWYHKHTFKSCNGGTLIEDKIEFKLPLFPFGQLALPMVTKDLRNIFQYRREITANSLQNKA